MRLLPFTPLGINLIFALSLLPFAFPPSAQAQWQDPYGAIHKDSSLIIAWANNCELSRGYINLADTSARDQESNRTTLGSPEDAVGMADGMVVSLGDRGVALYTLDYPVGDGQGPDFAIFENGFKELSPPYLWFLELAVVEVSSDGQNFVRFPAISNTSAESQTPTFGQLDPTQLFNLAGKYPVFYGTPFDLKNLKDSTGLDIHAVTHIRIIDVVGSIQTSYGTQDSNGNFINDPFPTPFWSGGFDLDALAILGTTSGERPSIFDVRYSVFPNPVKANHQFQISIENYDQAKQTQISILDATGRIIQKSMIDGRKSFCLPEAGIYFLIIQNLKSQYTQRLIVQ